MGPGQWTGELRLFLRCLLGAVNVFDMPNYHSSLQIYLMLQITMASLFAQRTVASTTRTLSRHCKPLAASGTCLRSARIFQYRGFSSSFQSLSSTRSRKETVTTIQTSQRILIKRQTIELQRRYTDSHEWIEVGSNGKSCKCAFSAVKSSCL
jgi:hypothetical protein